MNNIALILRDQQTAYKPGSRLSGEVQWNIELNSATIVVSVFYQTEGIGSEDATTILTQTIEACSTTGSQNFAFTLPSSPYSFSGKLITLRWAIGAEIKALKTLTIIPIIISPTDSEINLYCHENVPNLDQIKKPKTVEFNTY